MRALGVDLAWASPGDKQPNETGVVAIDESGTILDAGWTVGIAETAEWMEVATEDPVQAGLEFCASKQGTELEIAGADATSAATPVEPPYETDVAELEKQTERVFDLAAGAPAASDCAVNALERLAAAWQSAYPEPSQADTRLREVREFQREHDQALADFAE